MTLLHGEDALGVTIARSQATLKTLAGNSMANHLTGSQTVHLETVRTEHIRPLQQQINHKIWSHSPGPIGSSSIHDQQSQCVCQSISNWDSKTTLTQSCQSSPACSQFTNILDRGFRASNHMIGDKSLFSMFTPCQGNQTV